MFIWDMITHVVTKYLPRLVPNMIIANIDRKLQAVFTRMWPFLLDPKIFKLSLRKPYIIFNDHGREMSPIKA
jgi:hypothetical protein